MIEVHNVVLCLYFNENVAQANLHKTGDFIYYYYWANSKSCIIMALFHWMITINVVKSKFNLEHILVRWQLIKFEQLFTVLKQLLIVASVWGGIIWILLVIHLQSINDRRNKLFWYGNLHEFVHGEFLHNLFRTRALWSLTN